MSMFGVILVRIFPHSDWIGEIRSISPYSVQMRKNMDQDNSEYRHFSRSDFCIKKFIFLGTSPPILKWNLQRNLQFLELPKKAWIYSFTGSEQGQVLIEFLSTIALFLLMIFDSSKIFGIYFCVIFDSYCQK